MRYQEIDPVNFTNQSGVTRRIKLRRPFEVLQNVSSIRVQGDATLDEMVSRNDMAGAGTEFLAYKLADHNIVDIAEANYDLSRLNNIRIPVI